MGAKSLGNTSPTISAVIATKQTTITKNSLIPTRIFLIVKDKLALSSIPTDSATGRDACLNAEIPW